MTKQIIAMPLKEGSTELVYFEVDAETLAQDGEFYAQVSRKSEGAVATSEISFAKSLEHVRPAVDAIIDNLRDYKLKELNVEFGLSVGGGVGFLFAKTESEVTFKVSMKIVNG